MFQLKCLDLVTMQLLRHCFHYLFVGLLPD